MCNPLLCLCREEQEKLNVWVALLNLENMYGTEESLQKVFERAVLYCEPVPVHQQLADIYAKSNKIKVRLPFCSTSSIFQSVAVCSPVKLLDTRSVA